MKSYQLPVWLCVTGVSSIVRFFSHEIEQSFRIFHVFNQDFMSFICCGDKIGSAKQLLQECLCN